MEPISLQPTDFRYLEKIRLFELMEVLAILKIYNHLAGKVLEIGAGSGWQSRKMAENGYYVTAVDLPRSIYAEVRIWPVIIYDGKTFPFPDDYFDILYSSSVLEHISHLDFFQTEMQRVLKPNGLAIHVLPSSVWRLWTNIAHYVLLVKGGLKWVWNSLAPNTDEDQVLAKVRNLQFSEILSRAFVPERHGEFGSSVSELFSFSKRDWLEKFESANWQVEQYTTNRLFYSGHYIMGSNLSLKSRRALSRVFGSACHIFVLRNSYDG